MLQAYVVSTQKVYRNQYSKQGQNFGAVPITTRQHHFRFKPVGQGGETESAMGFSFQRRLCLSTTARLKGGCKGVDCPVCENLAHAFIRYGVALFQVEFGLAGIHKDGCGRGWRSQCSRVPHRSYRYPRQLLGTGTKRHKLVTNGMLGFRQNECGMIVSPRENKVLGINKRVLDFLEQGC